MGGLRYEVHRMPEGMRDKVLAQVLAKVAADQTAGGSTSEGDEETPCADCLRWDECQGVAEPGECPWK